MIANYAESAANGEEFSVRDIGRLGAIGGLGPYIVGLGEQIADQLQDWVEETDVDGFNLAYAITPGTLCQKLHGRGDRLPAEHKGATFRIGGTGSMSPR